MTVDDLRHAPIFAGLSDEQLSRLCRLANAITLPAEACLFRQGEPGDHFWLLCDGSVRVVKTFRHGRPTTVRFVQPNETFGESVLFHEVYPSTAETVKPSRVYRFPACDVRQLMLAEPELALAVMGSMARLLVVMNERIEELLLPAAARLARYLLDLCPTSDRSQQHLPVSKRELARRMGVTPETLSRTLRCLAAARSIEMRGRVIRILDRAALERVAQQ